MEGFIQYATKVMPPLQWVERQIGTNKVFTNFEPFKYSIAYCRDNDLVADVHLYYDENIMSVFENKKAFLLKTRGAKAYIKTDNIEDIVFEKKTIAMKCFEDLKQTVNVIEFSKNDPMISSSSKTNIVICYKKFMVCASFPNLYSVIIAHKILMNIVVSTYSHQEHIDIDKLIEKQECADLIDPVVCESCARPSQSVVFNLKLCAGCRKTRYCDKECQRKHWKCHKLICKETL